MEERTWPINHLEMRAVLLEQNVLRKKTCSCWSTTQHSSPGKTRFEAMFFQSEFSWIVCLELHLCLSPTHFTNVRDDLLSCRHQVINKQWILLHSSVCQVIFLRQGTPTIDLFMTQFNSQLQVLSPLFRKEGMGGGRTVCVVDGNECLFVLSRSIPDRRDS